MTRLLKGWLRRLKFRKGRKVEWGPPEGPEFYGVVEAAPKSSDSRIRVTVTCEHGNPHYCGLCEAEKAPKCEHGNAFYCGFCGPISDETPIPPDTAIRNLRGRLEGLGVSDSGIRSVLATA